VEADVGTIRNIARVFFLPVTGALVAGLVLVTGLVDFSAAKPPGKLEQRLATFALDRSVHRHAPNATNPLGGSAEVAAAGLALFKTHCVACYGGPGVDPTDGGASLNPPAPGLTLARVQARSDGELQWIVSNGIRMTGMPAFGASRSEEEVWQLVAALRRLPKLSAEERRMLRAER